jgi:hypothetical protein
MIYGCACDAGWDGPDCSQKSCPKGDDPMTTGVDEVKSLFRAPISLNNNQLLDGY